METVQKINEVEVWDNKGETFDRYTVFADGQVYGMSETASGFNQWIGTENEVEKGGHLGEKLSKIPQGIRNAIIERIKQK